MFCGKFSSDNKSSRPIHYCIDWYVIFNLLKNNDLQVNQIGFSQYLKLNSYYNENYILISSNGHDSVVQPP